MKQYILLCPHCNGVEFDTKDDHFECVKCQARFEDESDFVYEIVEEIH